MYIEKAHIESIQTIKRNIILIKANSPSIASVIKPGQFCNIKVTDNDFPLLRRPFSICDIEGDSLYFIFEIQGEGTRILSQKRQGDEIDILGPLGNGFDPSGNYETAVIVAGGIGIAPFPYLIRAISQNKEIVSFIGGKTKDQLITYGIKNYFLSTDDGSEGFRGTVVDLLKTNLMKYSNKKKRFFVCGPNPMLKAVQDVCKADNCDCQISVESSMACGFGICQGCPIEKSEEDGFYLVCKDGPVFNASMVKL